MIQTMQELNDLYITKGRIAVFHAGKLVGFGYERMKEKEYNFNLQELGIGACDYQTIKRCKE